jgi:hypothetical protein
LAKADFSPTSHFIALTLDGTRTGREPGADIYIAMNADFNQAKPMIPLPPSARAWRRVIDTGLPSPSDIAEGNDAPIIKNQARYPMREQSLIVLVGMD